MKKGIILGYCLVGFLFLANAQTDLVFKGKLLKKDWSKTLESYCAGGSDYFVLQQKGAKEIILDLSTIMAKTEIQPYLSAKKVWVSGKMENFIKTQSDPMMQQPVTPPSCEVLKVSKILFKSKK